MSNSMIGVYLTLRKGKDAPYYGRFINDGWIPGSRKSRKTSHKIPGQFFIQKSFAAQRENALRLIVADAHAGAGVLARKVGL
jgi:hypothetical protein